MKIKIKYFDKEIPRINKTDKGDWIDLRSTIDIELKKDEFKLIPLGVGIELPSGYEAHVAPRSSTYKNHGIIQTNGVGIIDEKFCGDNDQWFMPAYALRDTKINKYDRVCQFRIIERMSELEIEEVDIMLHDDRGGHGTTGIK